MNSLLNTRFELSLRIVLLLSKTKSIKLTKEKITCLDFIAVFAKEFNLSTSNLNENDKFKYAEFIQKYIIMDEILDNLISLNFIKEESYSYNKKYLVTELGLNFCNGLNNEYKIKYLDFISRALNNYLNLDDINIVNFILKKSLININKEN